MTKKLVTLFGGSGFIGRYAARTLVKTGYRVRVAVRRPHLAGEVRLAGAPGWVDIVQANVRNEESVAAALEGAAAAVNLVGILYEKGPQNYEAAQLDGAVNVAKACQAQGIDRLIHVSAIGADPEAKADYAKTKGEAEVAIREVMPSAVILRPSIVFGPEDQFFNRFAKMARLSPMIPVVGGSTRFQPVWVQDVAEAAARAALGKVAGGIYELGGPNTYSFRELIELMLRVIRRRRLIMDVPFFVARIQGNIFSLLPNPPITVDQVRLLKTDNVVGEGAQGFEALGIVPEAPDGIIESYLYPYRPYGQYATLTEGRQAED